MSRKGKEKLLDTSTAGDEIASSLAGLTLTSAANATIQASALGKSTSEGANLGEKPDFKAVAASYRDCIQKIVMKAIATCAEDDFQPSDAINEACFKLAVMTALGACGFKEVKSEWEIKLEGGGDNKRIDILCQKGGFLYIIELKCVYISYLTKSTKHGWGAWKPDKQEARIRSSQIAGKLITLDPEDLLKLKFRNPKYPTSDVELKDFEKKVKAEVRRNMESSGQKLKTKESKAELERRTKEEMEKRKTKEVEEERQAARSQQLRHYSKAFLHGTLGTMQTILKEEAPASHFFTSAIVAVSNCLAWWDLRKVDTDIPKDADDARFDGELVTDILRRRSNRC